MNKKALSLAVCLAVSYAPASYGLGLGEIESSSHLNQPFRAKINLLSTSAADAKRLKVRVASPEVFSRVGIERPKYLDNISFTPSVENGKPVIFVNSSQPINQPFLNFLLEVSWPNGQLLKEYTVLLDPPVLVQPGTAVANNTVGVRAEPKQQQPVQRVQPRTQPQPRNQTVAANKRTVAPRTETRQPARRSAAPTNRSNKYRVVRGDSLYKVAKKIGHNGVRTEQMMMALYRANPTAFRKRNVNNLKAGALLTRPSAQEARSMSYSQAKSAIYNQSSEWRKYRKQLAKKTVPQKQVKRKPKSAAPAKTVVAKNNNQARMEVIGSNATVDGKNVSATGSAKLGQLERKLVQANESLAAKANANTELKSRVSELESLLRKKNRLITLKNEQLAELQAKLGVPATATANKNAEGTDIRQQVKNGVNDAGDIVRSQQAVESNKPEQKQPLAVVEGNVNKIPPVMQPEPVEPEVKPVDITPEVPEVVEPKITPPAVDPVAEDGGILDMLSSPLVLGLGGGSLLALLAGGLLMRRRGKSDGYEEYSSIDFDDPDFAPGSTTKNDVSIDNDVQVSGAKTEDAFAGLEGDFDDLDFGDAVDAGDTIETKDAQAAETNDDILQEADVYIVYGLHDQAEVELKKAIEKQPNNLQYHAKLLENYQASSNVDAFNEQAEIFSKLPDDAEGSKAKLWDNITEWGKGLKSENSLFSSGSGIAGAAAAAAAAGGIAITAGKAFAEDKIEDVKDVFDGADDDIGLDLGDSLDMGLDDDLIKSVENKVETASLQDDDLDLSDLGLGDDDLSLDFDASDLGLNKKSTDDLDLDDLLSDSADFNVSEPASVNTDLDASSLDDLLDDVPETVAEKSNELGSEFEDLLDLDLSDLGGDLSVDDKPAKSDLGMSNLNLELNNDNDLNKILPSGSPYTSSKDDGLDADSLLGDLDDDLSFMDLDDGDQDLRETQVSTKLDLARAYLDMGDIEGARNTLEEVMMEGNDDQKKEAEELLHQTG